LEADVLRACGVSDAGRVRKTNEDTFVADPAARLFAVADGMGGHSAGEVASRLAIEAMADFIRRSGEDPDFTWPEEIDVRLSFDANRLRTAVQMANRRVYHAAGSSDAYSGMGTTIVGVLVNGGRVAVAGVGDSRVYLLAAGRIQQMTADDSWTATLLKQDPRLRAGDLAHHPMRNVLTKVLGANEAVDVRVSEHDLRAGDVLLLCSDGVHGVVDDEHLREILMRTPDVEQAARAVIEAALDGGSRDNVTAIVVRYEGKS
jgi:serine/threonine protein phosphatase PrpC